MISTQQAPSISQALKSHPELAGQDFDWDDPAVIDEFVYGDGEHGEGVDYHQGECLFEIRFARTWGAWVLSRGRFAPSDLHGTHTHTVYPNRREAKAAYIEAIEAKQAEGVEWEPDYCPIFDRVEATWK